MKDKKKDLALPEVSVDSFTGGNKEYPLKVEPAVYPKHKKYEQPINMEQDGQYQRYLTTEVPKGERIEHDITDKGYQKDLRQGDITPPGKSGFETPRSPGKPPELPGGSKN